MKYAETAVVFREIPDECSLAISISECKIHCLDCHSKHLWESIGDDLTIDAIDTLIKENEGITCICFMGGEYYKLKHFLTYIRKKYPQFKLGWYTGSNQIPKDYDIRNLLDYIKVGPYIDKFGGLDNPNTNQRMYQIVTDKLGRKIYTDITYRFQNNETKDLCKTF